MTKLRIGMGYDVHPLVEGRPLIIGGQTLDYYKGAAGHSDADVLVHAICDALLGAANLGDLGTHFPDNDPTFKDADSLMLLKQVVYKVSEKGFEIVNIDSTVCLQKPTLKNYIPAMAKNIAESSGISADNISVKATTTEKLGFIGREEGVSAYAIALIEKSSD